MRSVGIIANPASGKDIRRLVAYGSVFDNHEKVNIVRRVLLGLDSMGVREVHFMPEYFGIVPRAMADLDISIQTAVLDIKTDNTQEDSTRAAEALYNMEAACIITLGGDGTNRAIAKTCRDTPLLPISTGTNNVFPFMIESTMAGIAAGVLASNSVFLDDLTYRVPRLDLWRSDQLVDIALIDIVVSSAGFIASRAVWEVDRLHEVFLARAEPGNIGFSSIGGHLCALDAKSGKGVHIMIGGNGKTIKAPIAPGLISEIPIKSFNIFDPGVSILISYTPSVIALDGEREFIVKPGESLAIKLNLQGPRVVDIPKTLRKASEKSLFSGST